MDDVSTSRGAAVDHLDESITHVMIIRLLAQGKPPGAHDRGLDRQAQRAHAAVLGGDAVSVANAGDRPERVIAEGRLDAIPRDGGQPPVLVVSVVYHHSAGGQRRHPAVVVVCINDSAGRRGLGGEVPSGVVGRRDRRCVGPCSPAVGPGGEACPPTVRPDQMGLVARGLLDTQQRFVLPTDRRESASGAVEVLLGAAIREVDLLEAPARAGRQTRRSAVWIDDSSSVAVEAGGGARPVGQRLQSLRAVLPSRCRPIRIFRLDDPVLRVVREHVRRRPGTADRGQVPARIEAEAHLLAAWNRDLRERGVAHSAVLDPSAGRQDRRCGRPIGGEALGRHEAARVGHADGVDGHAFRREPARLEPCVEPVRQRRTGGAQGVNLLRSQAKHLLRSGVHELGGASVSSSAVPEQGEVVGARHEERVDRPEKRGPFVLTAGR
jgi:hypothetical protein